MGRDPANQRRTSLSVLTSVTTKCHVDGSANAVPTGSGEGGGEEKKKEKTEGKFFKDGEVNGCDTSELQLLL